ncbi:MAG: hypothetical protein WCO26_06740 [Deltaproteobacteria bacterium]
MSKSLKIILLDNTFDLTSLEDWKEGRYHSIICLFWIAPSTRQLLSAAIGGSCYGLADIVGSDMEWGETAYKLATQIVQDGPSYGDLRLRTYLTERIYRECHILKLLIMVANFIEKLRVEQAASEVAIDSSLGEEADALLVRALSNYPGLIYHHLKGFSKLRDRTRGKNSMILRLGKRIREACLTGDWRSQVMDSVEWMDKTYRWRASICRRVHPQNLSKGGVTFFSSYLNDSRVLSPFADLMPWPVRWVLTNDSSRRGIAKGDLPYSWIWQFAQSKAFHQGIIDEELLLKDGLGSADFDLIKNWVAINPTWRDWKSVELPLLVTLTQCWEAYLEEAKPRLVVMANQWGIEGWFTQIAKRRNIPVLQLLHGVLGGYLYTRTPIISDLMVVPGEFWRDLWGWEQQHKILVCNPANSMIVDKKKEALQRRVLTFFSWPLSLAPFHNFSELMDGFIHIFHKLVSEGVCRIIFRAHPRENPSAFVQRWSLFHGPLPPEVQVSKNEPLSHVLSKTDVALMFRSTVMLDCLVNKIPVVMPGWIDFGWNHALTGLSNISLVSDFHELQQRLIEWLGEPPQEAGNLSEFFVRPPGIGKDKLIAALQELISPGMANDELINRLYTKPQGKRSCNYP